LNNRAFTGLSGNIRLVVGCGFLGHPTHGFDTIEARIFGFVAISKSDHFAIQGKHTPAKFAIFVYVNLKYTHG